MEEGIYIQNSNAFVVASLENNAFVYSLDSYDGAIISSGTKFPKPVSDLKPEEIFGKNKVVIKAGELGDILDFIRH